MQRWQCLGSCKRGWTQNDLDGCPACGGALEYKGTILEPIVTVQEDLFERMVTQMAKEPKVTRLPEATRSDMQQGVYHTAAKRGVDVAVVKKERQQKQQRSKQQLSVIFRDCGHFNLGSRGHYVGKESGEIEFYIYFCKRCKKEHGEGYKALKNAILNLRRMG